MATRPLLARINKLTLVLLFLLALWNAGRQAYEFHHWSLLPQDSMVRRDTILERVRSTLKERGITQLGFFVETGVDAVGEYFAVQYGIAPAILHDRTPQDRLVLVDYFLSGKPFPTPELTVIEDFGGGFVLCERQ